MNFAEQIFAWASAPLLGKLKNKSISDIQRILAQNNTTIEQLKGLAQRAQILSLTVLRAALLGDNIPPGFSKDLPKCFFQNIIYPYTIENNWSKDFLQNNLQIWQREVVVLQQQGMFVNFLTIASSRIIEILRGTLEYKNIVDIQQFFNIKITSILGTSSLFAQMLFKYNLVFAGILSLFYDGLERGNLHNLCRTVPSENSEIVANIIFQYRNLLEMEQVSTPTVAHHQEKISNLDIFLTPSLKKNSLTSFQKENTINNTRNFEISNQCIVISPDESEFSSNPITDKPASVKQSNTSSLEESLHGIVITPSDSEILIPAFDNIPEQKNTKDINPDSSTDIVDEKSIQPFEHDFTQTESEILTAQIAEENKLTDDFLGDINPEDSTSETEIPIEKIAEESKISSSLLTSLNVEEGSSDSKILIAQPAYQENGSNQDVAKRETTDNMSDLAKLALADSYTFLKAIQSGQLPSDVEEISSDSLPVINADMAFISSGFLTPTPVPVEKYPGMVKVFDEKNVLANRSTKKNIPNKIGHYQILDIIASGGVGTVYKAQDSLNKRLVAIKKMQNPEHSTAEDFIRFRQEASLATTLNHPNIVKIYDSGIENNMPYLVMEYVIGTPLSKIVAQKITIERCLVIVLGILEGLKYAHSKGIIHRDIKPSNIMLMAYDMARIMDFGLAKNIFAKEQQITKVGQVLGTPQYMSPEQARGRVKELDGRTDIYSVGVVMYEMLAGVAAIQGITPVDILYNVINKEPIDLKHYVANLPLAIAAICQKAMNKDLNNRYANAEEMILDIQRYQQGQPVLALHSYTSSNSFFKWFQKNKNIAIPILITIFSVIICLMTILIYYFSKNS